MGERSVAVIPAQAGIQSVLQTRAAHKKPFVRCADFVLLDSGLRRNDDGAGMKGEPR